MKPAKNRKVISYLAYTSQLGLVDIHAAQRRSVTSIARIIKTNRCIDNEDEDDV